jgi:hypothetical protein
MAGRRRHRTGVDQGQRKVVARCRPGDLDVPDETGRKWLAGALIGMSFQLDGLHRPVIVVGGGQAGLSMSHCLTTAGVGHLVLERERAGHEWRTRRWDSFCLGDRAAQRHGDRAT